MRKALGVKERAFDVLMPGDVCALIARSTMNA